MTNHKKFRENAGSSRNGECFNLPLKFYKIRRQSSDLGFPNFPRKISMYSKSQTSPCPKFKATGFGSSGGRVPSSAQVCFCWTRARVSSVLLGSKWHRLSWSSCESSLQFSLQLNGMCIRSEAFNSPKSSDTCSRKISQPRSAPRLKFVNLTGRIFWRNSSSQWSQDNNERRLKKITVVEDIL